MTALTTERAAPQYGGHVDPPKLPALGLAAATKIYAGGIVCKNSSGYAVPGSTSTSLVAVGIAPETVDNSAGANAAQSIVPERGVFPFVNSGGGDLITIADVGNVCYMVDDNVVAKTSGGSTRSIAGVIMGFDGTAVLVALGVVNALSVSASDAKALQSISLNITDTDLTDSDGSQSFDFAAALPANAVILGYDIRVAEAFTDGAAGVFTLDVGISGGDLDQLVDGAALGSIANIANAPGIRPTGKYGAVTLAATALATVNLDTATAGDVTIEVFYAAIA